MARVMGMFWKDSDLLLKLTSSQNPRVAHLLLCYNELTNKIEVFVMNIPFIKAKAAQYLLFIPRITWIAIFNHELNSDLRSDGFLIDTDRDMTSLEMYRIFYKVYPDGSTGG